MKEIITQCAAGLLALSVIVEITPIKINPWKWLARRIGRAINGEVLERQEKTETLLKKHLDDESKKDAKEARQHVLRFNDEILQGIRHTKEHFDEVLEDIDEYESYCRTHPEYPNNKAVLAIENIRLVYSTALKEHDFL